MKKKIFIFTAIILLIALVLPYAYVEIMTSVHYEETVDLYEKTGWILSDNYHKVFSFSEDSAKVLYSEPDRVSMCEFSKDENGNWVYKNIEPLLFRNKLSSSFSKISEPEKLFYPIYTVKHLIEPEESKENFDYYEQKLKTLAEEEKFSFDVVLAENNIDRTISVYDENSDFVIELFNDYDGYSGYEQAEITYSCKNEFDLDLLVRIQECLMQKTADEKTIGEVLDPNTVLSEAKLVRDMYPDASEIKTKDLLGNGEYLLSYISNGNDKIILISGTTKRDGIGE